MKSMRPSSRVVSPYLKGWSILRVEEWMEIEGSGSVAIDDDVPWTLF